MSDDYNDYEVWTSTLFSFSFALPQNINCIPQHNEMENPSDIIGGERLTKCNSFRRELGISLIRRLVQLLPALSVQHRALLLPKITFQAHRRQTRQRVQII